MKLLVRILFISLSVFAVEKELESETEIKKSRFNAKISNTFYTNRYKSSSARSNFFLYSTAGLGHQLTDDLKVNYRLSYLKRLENYREGYLNDFQVSSVIASIKLSDKISYSLTPIVKLVLSPDKRKQYYEKGSIGLNNNFSYQLNEKISLGINPRITKYIHKYKTNFFGGSNTSYAGAASFWGSYAFNSKLSLYTEWDWKQPVTYRNNKKDTIGAFLVNASYAFNSNFKMNIGVSSENSILNDIGETRGVTDYIVTNNSLFYGGIDVLF